MKRQICKAKCVGFGSAMRSATCSIEHGCIEFEINGVRYMAFEKPTLHANMFRHGQEYDLSFIYKGHKELQYVQVVQ